MTVEAEVLLGDREADERHAVHLGLLFHGTRHGAEDPDDGEVVAANPHLGGVRAVFSQVAAVAAVLPATVDPASPAAAQVTEESGILEAEVAAKGAYSGLFLGLGAVALLVGGVGIANVMVISVLERRSEIGLRRALGATRRHVAEQFLAEALLLSALGGLAGTIIGFAVTAIYAYTQHSQLLIPPQALYGGTGAALAIGAIAGLYPAARAARLSPTQALRTV